MLPVLTLAGRRAAGRWAAGRNATSRRRRFGGKELGEEGRGRGGAGDGPGSEEVLDVAEERVAVARDEAGDGVDHGAGVVRHLQVAPRKKNKGRRVLRSRSKEANRVMQTAANRKEE